MYLMYVRTFEDVEGQSSHGNADHPFTVFEELDGLCVEGEIPEVLVVEEVDGVLVEMEGERLEEGDVIGQHFLIGEIQLQHNDGVDVVVREKVICKGEGFGGGVMMNFPSGGVEL